MDSSMLRVPLASSDGCGVLIHTSTRGRDPLAALHVTFTKDQDRFLEIMRHAIAVNGSFFNTQRTMSHYVVNTYDR
jgi:hypothetical protein